VLLGVTGPDVSELIPQPDVFALAKPIDGLALPSLETVEPAGDGTALATATNDHLSCYRKLRANFE
jgi:hypothetical protein